MNEAPTPLLSVRDLRVSFAMDEGLVRAVDGTSFDVMPGQVQACAGHKRLLRDPSAREAGAFGTMEPGERAALSPYTLAIFALARHLCPPASHSALRRPAVAPGAGVFSTAPKRISR